MNRKIVLPTLLSLLFSLFVATPVYGAVRCETQYGGAQKCIKTGELQINKKVCSNFDPKERVCKGSFTDNLDLSQSKRFAPGEEILFHLEIKNVGDENFNSVKVTDTLPRELERVSGDTSFELKDLGPGKSESREFTARFVSDRLPDRNVDCVVNVAEARADNAFDKDQATVCFEKQKAAAPAKPKQLPKAGPEDWYLIIGLSSFAGITGLYLRKFAKI